MGPEKFAFGLTIISITLGLLGNILANFLWERLGYIQNNRFRNYAKWVVGLIAFVGVVYMLLQAYSIYSSMN